LEARLLRLGIQGKHKDLDAAYDQLLLYREALENPPLLVVCDLDRILVHTNFTGARKEVHEIPLDKLAEPRRRARGPSRGGLAGPCWVSAVLSLLSPGGTSVAQLIVRRLAPEIVAALRERAARKGRSVEAEHREILREVLQEGPRKRLKELLQAMPPVGEDRDFERPRSRARRVRL